MPSRKDKRAVLAEVTADFIDHTTLHGYRYLAEPGRHWVERVLWLLVHIAATVGVVWQVRLMYTEYENQVPITTVQSMHYHVSLVPFPAIAVCDINKIRRSRARELAAHLIRSYGLDGISVNNLTILLRYLGRLYDNSIVADHDVARLVDLFTTYNVTLDYYQTMQKLSTSCEELILACKWDGEKRNCSDLFETRKTMEGYCCTFNYIRLSDNFDTRMDSSRSREKIRKRRDGGDSGDAPSGRVSIRAGASRGLSVVVSSNMTDYFYPLLPTSGVKRCGVQVLIYNPLDYPDTASGSLIEKLVMPQQEVFFSLSAVTTLPTQDVAQLPKVRRRCLFSTEKVGFSGYYSYSDCLMECRIRSMLNLCGCLPFFSPMNGKEDATRACELRDVACLNKHTEMWQTQRPTEFHEGLELEMTQSLPCSNCYPSCGDTAYSVQSSVMPLVEVLVNNSGLLPPFKLQNESVLHIFFGSTSQTLMKKSVLMAWYNLLSNVGGICGVFIGFSAMSVVELVYFFTVRMVVIIWSRGRQRAQVTEARHRPGPPSPPIHPRYPPTPTTATLDGLSPSWERLQAGHYPQKSKTNLKFLY